MYVPLSLLKPNESMLWSGKPNNQSRASDEMGKTLLSFGALLLSLTVLYSAPMMPPVGVGIDWFVTFWILPVVFFASALIGFCWNAFLVKSYRNTLSYIVTNHRILIIGGWFNTKIHELHINQLDHVEIRDQNNHGHIRFYPKKTIPLYYNLGFKFSRIEPITFWDIDCVQEVYQMIQKIRPCQILQHTSDKTIQAEVSTLSSAAANSEN